MPRRRANGVHSQTGVCMIHPVFLVTLSYFLIGAAAIGLINTKTGPDARRTLWTKYAVYFVIVHAVILSVLAEWFLFVASCLVAIGLLELLRMTARNPEGPPNRLPLALTAYLLLCFGFVRFALIGRSQEILFVYLVVLTFDGFSQITGQLVGAHRLAPRVSPGKTLEGLVGGVAFALMTAALASSWSAVSRGYALALSSLLCASALAGDLAASWLKRSCRVKDFGNLLPGHGGVLDRFDSFIAAGCVYWVCVGER